MILLALNLIPVRLSCSATGGLNLQEALANTGLAMYNYMTPIEGLTIDHALDR